MTPVKRPATWLFLGVFILSCLCLHFDYTPAAVDNSPADTLFSVKNAYSHLGRIASAPHSLGTAANDDVCFYLDSAARSLGLEVSRLPWTSVNALSQGLLIARGTNVLATLKGATKGGKKILVMGHLDSQPNSLGAGDDGSACAAMLETARALKAGPPLDRDVVFLFTNGEEDGMLGATAFAKDSANLRDIGLVLNFDGRGNAGNCIMFRTSPHSHWLVDAYAHAPIHHVTGSFYNELFNFLPNNTDFTPFLKAHMSGLDFAYVDGFTAYHNLTDNTANIDKRSMQEEGDNMLGSIRYFSRMDLESAGTQTTDTHANDTFFNIVGPLMVHYSPTLNFMLVLFANLLVVLSLGYGLYQRRIRIGPLLLGLLVFIVTLAVLYFVARYTLLALRNMYPLYFGYYPNSYNGPYFYAALAAESATVFILLYRWPLRRWTLSSLFMAVLLLLLALLDCLYRFIPSGVYWLYWPLIGAAAAFPFLRTEKTRNGALPRYWPIVLALLPVVLLLTQMVYSLALAFDFQGEAAINAVVIGLLLGLTLPLMKMAFRESRWTLPAFAVTIFAIAAIIGIALGGYNERHPFKTDLHYLVQADKHQSFWQSANENADRFNKTYLSNPTQTASAYIYPLEKFRSNAPVLSSPAPYVDLPAPQLLLNRVDTVTSQRLLHCQPPPGTTTIHLSFDPEHPPTGIRINDQDYPGPIGWLDYINPDSSGFDLLVTTPKDAPLTISATGRTLGLPAAAGFKGYPSNVIPFPGALPNTTLVQRSFSF